MSGPDQLTRFAFSEMPVRGAVVKLDAAWQAIRGRNPVRPEVLSVLGEATAASALMFSNIKLEGRIGLQLQGSGPIRLLLAQCTSSGHLRAMVREDRETAAQAGDFPALTREATLAITIEKARNNQRYQGIVPLEGGSLGAALEGYFRQSEQLPTRLWLLADGQRAAGLILQRIPGEARDEDGWRRVVQLAETLTPGELLSLPSPEILRRLYHRERIGTQPPQDVAFACSCSRQRVAEVLRALGPEELEAAAQDTGYVDVNCEFCNAAYRFDAVDVGQLFSDFVPEAASRTRH